MSWTIDCRSKDVLAMHVTGATFRVSRSGWVTVQEASGLSAEVLKNLIAELHDVLGNTAQKGDMIH